MNVPVTSRYRIKTGVSRREITDNVAKPAETIGAKNKTQKNGADERVIRAQCHVGGASEELMLPGVKQGREDGHQ